jgi:hypothetical protein
MKRRRVLYTSKEVRNTIIELFSSAKGRRVAITAFVGRGAEAYLPKPEGLELICWLKAGGTNPYVLRRLIDRQAEISFVDSLHMKLYWTEDKGAVITSANLSTNALGAGNLKEIGIYLPAGQLDIEKVLRHLKERPVTNQELFKLDKQHLAYQKVTREKQPKSQWNSFAEWYKLQPNSKWKIGWGDTVGDFSKKAKEIVKAEYNVSRPHDFALGQRGDYQENDWVLNFDLSKSSPTRLRWMAVDYVVRVTKSDKKAYCHDYPYQAVQVHSMRHYADIPFRIDRQFRSAFSKAVREFGIDKLKESGIVKPGRKLINLIHENY